MNKKNDQLAELNDVLNRCLNDLDKATKLIADIPLEPVKRNIFDMGEAIGAILYARRNIYKLNPDLRTPVNEEQVKIGDEMRIFRAKASDKARLLKEQGQYDEAIKIFREFINKYPSNRFVKIAEEKISILEKRKNT